ncbi:MAG: membrane protein insertion efficiency factor YidD [Candidatus Fermentibacteraceae bacterium]|nr:membrane protein insertion efficiency factor YidD [Candidatus Fermentibacteraceae bacterium]
MVRDFLDRRCNFIPSCSHYGQMAISRFGPVLGTMIALERWTRCHSSARGLDYYTRDEEAQALRDPVDTGEGNVVWDSLLLPF